MQHYRTAVLAGLVFVGAAWAQTPPSGSPQQEPAKPVFRTETRLVPVDVVVTDKKNNYVHNLELKNFKVWEDNKEQTITSFSFEADPASPVASQKRYIILFFDLTSMNVGDQMQARQAASKFIDSTNGPNRLMAVVNYGGWLQIAQNFTDDTERLKQVVTGVHSSALVSNTGIGGPESGGGVSIGGANGSFGARSVLLALGSLAKRLADVPGRKTLIFFSAGFPSMAPEVLSEVTTAVSACNHANVAVYPVDVRGLAVPAFAPRGGLLPRDAAQSGLALATSPILRMAAFFQRGGTSTGSTGAGSGAGTSGGGGGAAPPSRSGGTGLGGSGTAGSGSGGGTRTGNPGYSGGSRPGMGTTGGMPRGGGSPVPVVRDPTDPRNARNVLIPRIPDSVATNQQVLYALASGTGGFVIANTNDLVGGLDKINREQNEYYLLAYSAPESAEGSCHTIRVKVDRGGTNLRARNGYCNVKSADVLAGRPVERDLETRLSGTQPDTLPAAAIQAPFFYTSANTARVNVVLDLPTADVKFQKVKGKQHAELNVLGIAYRPNGNVAARFSDTVKVDLDDKKDVEKFQENPYHYENQFDSGAGQYTLKVAFSSGGEGFGKVEIPLQIDPYTGSQFAMSGIVLSTTFHKISDVQSDLDAEMLEGRVPLIAQGVQFTPAGAYQFKKGQQVLVYFEVYEPMMTDEKVASITKVAAQLRVVDRQTGSTKVDSGNMDLGKSLRAGNPVVPVGLRLPMDMLSAGAYRLELHSMDSAGRETSRTAEFNVQ